MCLARMLILRGRMLMIMRRRCAVVIVRGSRVTVLPAVPAHRHARSSVDRREPLNGDRNDQQRCGKNPEKRPGHCGLLY